MVRKCPVCAKLRARQAWKSQPGSNKAPSNVFKEMSIDLQIVHEYGNILTVTDRYSRYTFVRLLKDGLAPTVVEALKCIFCNFCFVPKSLYADNGGQFLSAEYLGFLKFYGISPNNSLPYSPWMNGLAERPHAIILKCLRVLEKTNITPDTSLALIENFLNTVPFLRAPSQLICPASLVFTHALDGCFPLVASQLPGVAEGVSATRNQSRAEAAISTQLEAFKARYKIVSSAFYESVWSELRNNVRSALMQQTEDVPLKCGDKVLYYSRRSVRSKLDSPWTFGEIIASPPGQRIIDLQNESGEFIRVHSRNVYKVPCE